jgi:DNA-binding NarL/FixJ family response regulator
MIMEQAPVPTLKKRTVFLVEDHPIVRQGLVMLLNGEPDLEICGDAGSIAETPALVRKLKPDIVIVDISLADGSGLDLIKQLHDADANLPILALSMHDEAVFAERAVRAGAKGYVMKAECT